MLDVKKRLLLMLADDDVEAVLIGRPSSFELAQLGRSESVSTSPWLEAKAVLLAGVCGSRSVRG